MIDIETFNDALIECVKAAGGSKVVGPKLFPEKSVEVAQRQLLACMNPDRPEKLSPDQAVLVMQLATNAGSDVGIAYLCKTLSYSMPTRIQPEDEKAILMRELIQSQKEQAERTERLLELIAKSGQ